MSNAVVLFSGGVDSSAILYYLAKVSSKKIFPLYFNYGQKQSIQEFNAMIEVIDYLPIERKISIQPIKAIDLQSIKRIFKSSLTDPDISVTDVAIKGENKEDNTNVPFRNIIFISVGCAYADSVGASEIFIGNHRPGDELETPHYDATPEISVKLQEVVEMASNYKIRLRMPFADLLKHEIYKSAKNLGVPFHLTWSCYAGNEVPCGKCRACHEREKGFKDAGIIVAK